MRKFFRYLSVTLMIAILLECVGLSGAGLFRPENAYAEENAIDLKISFQPYGISVPDGYLPDYGEEYGDKGGISYGWNINHTDATAIRNENPDPLLDTLCQFHDGGVWEMGLENGTYDVTVSVGDAVYGEEASYHINVEGTNYWNNIHLEPGQYLQDTRRVEVEDGKLTIGQGSGWETAINFVHITGVTEPEAIIPAAAPQIKLQMYNTNRNDVSNTISPDFKLINTGEVPIDLSKVKIRYYFMLGGEAPQNFWCDWSSAGTANVTGSFIRNPNPMVGADTFLEIGFNENTGLLAAGQNVEIKTRFARTRWENFLQSDDYSYNPSSTSYEDWSSVTVYFDGEPVWGEEPTEPLPLITAAKVQMYNVGRSAQSSDVHPMFKLYNTGTLPFDLEDVTIRYYYTIDGEKPQNFWCDWSDRGSGNVTGSFVKVPFTADGVDYYYEVGFLSGAGTLIAGDSVEMQTRFAKNDWSSFSQSNDYSFNPSSTGYEDWTKVGVYIHGELVWGEGLLFGVPENVGYQAIEDEITVSWDPVEGATGFDVEVDGGVIDNGMNTSYTHGNLLPGELHTYRIRAISPIMDGDWSDPVEIWTLPDIPQNITATSTGNSISLSWDPVAGAAGYDVEVQGAAVDNGPNTVFTQTGLNANLQQTYRVRAKNTSGAGKWSGIVAIATLSVPPSNLNTTSTDTEIRISWNIAAGATGYDVEIDGGPVVSVTGTFYLHSGLSSYTEHSYRVRSVGADGASTWTERIYATTLLSVPAQFEARVTSSGIIVTWEAVENAIGYDLEVDGILINAGGSTAYTHKGYLPNTEHTYRVRAKNGNTTSLWSEEITRKTLTGVPVNLTATATSTEITVTWDPVTGAEGYELEIDGIILDAGVNTSYHHAGLAPNSAHTYRVRAKNDAGASPWSESVTKSTLLGTPINVQGAATTTSITITWDEVEGADGYDIMADGVVIDNGNGLSYTHSGLEPNSVHIYRIRAKAGGITGQWSAELSEWSETIVFASKLGIPGNIHATAQSTKIILIWDEVSGATGYEVEADGLILGIGNDTLFIHEQLLSNTTHTYRVRARSSSTIGEWSDLLTKKTTAGVPANLRAEATTAAITVMWDAVEGALVYDLEVDGEFIEDIREIQYTQQDLLPNTRHGYRVRAISEDGPGEWSEKLEKNTNPEININVAKDYMFNFVIAVPRKQGVQTRTITVNYNPDEVEVADLYGSTQKTDLDTGLIEGTNITVQEIGAGTITYTVPNTGRTAVVILKFISKTNEPSKVVYKIE